MYCRNSNKNGQSSSPFFDMKNKNKTEIVLLYCQHCGLNDSKILVAVEKLQNINLRSVMMPCSSKIQVPYLLKILEDGADGIEIIACPEDSCKFLVGSRRIEKRIEYTKNLLKSISMNPEVLGITKEHNLTTERLVELVEKRVEATARLFHKKLKNKT